MKIINNFMKDHLIDMFKKIEQLDKFMNNRTNMIVDNEFNLIIIL